MKKALLLGIVGLVLGIATSQAAPDNAARFGYYWLSNTLPYDTEFSYFYDVAVYPDGVFADCDAHSFVYVTAQNKHIGYGNTTYGVEAVMQYGFGVLIFRAIMPR
jgi:hypothetical protein